MENTLQQIPNWYESELMAWAPPEDILVSEWAEKYRILEAPAEERGPLRLNRTPYLIPILDSVLDPAIQTIVFCKPAQIAGTEAMISIIGYFSHQDPCPIMLVLADEDTARYMSRERIQKMYRSSPELKNLIIENLFNIEEITLLNGSYLVFSWASSVGRLASRPMRIVVCDEVDKPGYYVTTKEGSPITLAEQRLETYYKSKFLILSTPTLETGNIWKQLDTCDVVYDWHVPCPYCGQKQPLRWSLKFATGFPDGKYRAADGTYHPIGGVVWEGGRNATIEQIDNAGYQCGECGKIWNTVEKNRAVEKGEMVPRTAIPSRVRKVGFHINRLYSLLGRSGDIPRMVDIFIKSLANPEDLQTFINSALADIWKQVVIKTSESKILSARCSLPAEVVPQEAVALTCGIDCQKFGFWVVVRAWANDYTSWLVYYGYLAEWINVEEFLFQTQFKIDETDQSLSIWRAGIDIGGGKGENEMSMTEEAYWFVLKNRNRGVDLYPCKGASRPLARRVELGQPLEKTPSGRAIPFGLRILSIDTPRMKDLFHARIENAAEGNPQAAYLHADVDHVYIKQILAEEKRLNKKGLSEWVRIRHDNHLLDCEVLAHAAADPEWPGGGIHKFVLPRKTKKTIINKSPRTWKDRNNFSRPSWLNR